LFLYQVSGDGDLMVLLFVFKCRMSNFLFCVYVWERDLELCKQRKLVVGLVRAMLRSGSAAKVCVVERKRGLCTAVGVQHIPMRLTKDALKAACCYWSDADAWVFCDTQTGYLIFLTSLPVADKLSIKKTREEGS
jgi:hypothetical protein